MPIAHPIKYMNQMVFRQVIVSGVQPCRKTGMTVSELLTAFQQTLHRNPSPFNREYIVKASPFAWWANCSIELVQIPAVSESWVVYKIGSLGRSKRPQQGRQKQRTHVPSAWAAEGWLSGHVNIYMCSWMAGWAQSVVGANAQLVQATHTCCWAKTSKEFRGRQGEERGVGVASVQPAWTQIASGLILPHPALHPSLTSKASLP